MFIQTYDKDRRAVGLWLLFMAAIVFLMVVVGGATRLTESGLSMVDWRPVTGVLPPIGDDAWAEEFAKYQTSPEYQLKNNDMSVEEFKGIFYWEWGHRLLGRLIGFFFVIPFVWFLVKGRIPYGYKLRLTVFGLLGLSQGLLGWYMVQSGLVDEPAVSHYRLAAHLMLALFIFAALFWTALSLLRPKPMGGTRNVRGLSYLTLGFLTLQLFMGALVAGLKAGLIYNEWPMMGEGFVPSGLLDLSPVWRNFIDNATTVQFDHRIMAYIITALSIVILVRSLRATIAVRNAAYLLALAVFFQVMLGIVTLVTYVPVIWGTLHQAGGVLVLAALLLLLHNQKKHEAR